MHRPLGRAWLVVYAPFSLAVARLHCIARWAARSFARLGRRACWLGRQHFLCRGTIRLFVFGEFWAAAKFAKHYASSASQKFSKKSLYFIRRRLPVRLRRKKFIKGVFARFRPHPAYAIVPYSFRDIAWRGKAESILVTEVVTIPHPPTQSSLCARGSSAFGAFACLRSKPAFPQKNP